MEWILGFALVVVLPIAVAGYSCYRRDLAAARARVLAAGRIVATRRGPVEYATLGDGPPVLVLHGTSGGWDQGLLCARGLVAHGFQVIAPSRFGYLRTPLPADASPEAEADTWAALLDALRITRVPVMAFSAGATPAVQLALRHPGRVTQLVLVVPAAAGLYSKRSGSRPRLLLDALYRSDFVMWLLMRVAPRVLFGLVGVPSSLAARLPAAQRAQVDEVIEWMLPVTARRQGVLNEVRVQTRRAEYPLDRISAPTLLISAADDLYRTLPIARHAAAIIPRSRLIEFARGGHLLLGHETAVSSSVARFLQDANEATSTAA